MGIASDFHDVILCTPVPVSTYWWIRSWNVHASLTADDICLKLICTESCWVMCRPFDNRPPPCLSIFCILLKTRERKYLCGTFLEGLLAFVEVFAAEFGFGIVPSALIAEHVRIVYHVKRVFMFRMPFRGCPVCHGMPLAGGPQGVTSLQISVFLSWENGLFFSRGCILFALPSITII